MGLKICFLTRASQEIHVFRMNLDTLHLIVVFSHQTLTAASSLGLRNRQKNSSDIGSSQLLNTYSVPGHVLMLYVDYFTRFPQLYEEDTFLNPILQMRKPKHNICNLSKLAVWMLGIGDCAACPRPHACLITPLPCNTWANYLLSLASTPSSVQWECY